MVSRASAGATIGPERHLNSPVRVATKESEELGVIERVGVPALSRGPGPSDGRDAPRCSRIAMVYPEVAEA